MSEKPESSNASTRFSSTNLWLVATVLALVVLLGIQLWGRWSSSERYVSREITPKGNLNSDEQSTIQVFQKTSPSVVFIRTKGYQPFLFGRGQEKELSSGTGFVWDRQGHIVTNLHVVEEALRSSSTALEVQFADKSVADAVFVGGVREHDIAILKVNVAASLLLPIPLGTSDDLQVGQLVLAIGSPFGFDQTLSTGVIGGLNRSVAAEGGSGLLAGLIQTDAAINPGNSGGPLLDSSGRMIGVNTAIVSPTGAYSGLGFAVSVSSVVAAVETVLVESIGNPRPVLGITVWSPEQTAKLGLRAEIISRGLFIKQIDPGGPAFKTALRPTQQRGFQIILGDQIVSVDGEQVRTLPELQAALALRKPGDVVSLEIIRGDQGGEVEVTLDAQKLIF